jgi:hypothetical protein
LKTKSRAAAVSHIHTRVGVVSDRFSVLVNVFETMFIYPPICRLIDLDAVQGAMNRAAQPASGTVGPTAAQRRVAEKVVDLAKAESWLDLSVMAGDALRTARELREVEPRSAGVIYHTLGNCYYSLGQHSKAMELYEQGLTIQEELDDRTGQGDTYNNLGLVLAMKAPIIFHGGAAEAFFFSREAGPRVRHAKVHSSIFWGKTFFLT